MESTSVCETVSAKSAAGWLRVLFSVFPTSVYILGFEFAWILTLFLMFNKKQCLLPCCVSFFVSVCLCACSCSLERGVVFLM